MGQTYGADAWAADVLVTSPGEVVAGGILLTGRSTEELEFSLRFDDGVKNRQPKGGREQADQGRTDEDAHHAEMMCSHR